MFDKGTGYMFRYQRKPN